ncbi:MAG: D-alanyl-D-alanine carboxypeptidase family protein, partial [Pseudomonadota bacterium]
FKLLKTNLENMITNKFLTLIFTIFISLLVNIPIAQAVLTTKAKQAVLYDANSNMILYAKNHQELMPPSSMSKLMTLYILFEQIDQGNIKLDDEFLVSEKAWRKKGSKMFVGYNSKVKVEDLIRGIVVQSGNDACIVVAEAISGSEDSFVKLMNNKAKFLQLKDSNFTNSTGWPDPEHRMTAMDIMYLSKRLIEDFPDLYHYFNEMEFTYNDIRQFNRNILLNDNIGVDGLKTGFTQEAGYGISVSATRNQRRLLVVVNGLKSKSERIQEAAKLLEYGYRNFELVKLFDEGEKIDKAEVWFGVEDYIPLVTNQEVILSLPRNWQDNIKVNLIYNSPVPAPITKGQELAKIKITSDKINDSSDNIVEIPLYAGKDMSKLPLHLHIIESIKYYIFKNK